MTTAHNIVLTKPAIIHHPIRIQISPLTYLDARVGS